MTNHYHLLVETPEPNLVAGMRWFQTTYTVRFNRRHRLSGHLFQGRYKAVVVDPNERGYFVTLSDYIHLNPVRAGMIGLGERLFDYPWSSYRWYTMKKERREWFEPAQVLAELGFNDTAAERQCYAARMRARAVDERAGKNSGANDRLRRGWCLGAPSFRERILSLLEETGEKFSQAKALDSAVRRSHGEGEARRLLQTAMAYFGISIEDLNKLKRNDPRKLAIAQLIRSRTTVPNKWIVATLGLGHVSGISRYCCEGKAEGELARELGNRLGDAKA
jgi:hypothetical protein